MFKYTKKLYRKFSTGRHGTVTNIYIGHIGMAACPHARMAFLAFQLSSIQMDSFNPKQRFNKNDLSIE